MISKKCIALVGIPNSGKTSLFNLISGHHQPVGNYPGVTVEKKLGFFLNSQNERIVILDLPGCYSLKSKNLDEKVTSEVLLNFKKPFFQDYYISHIAFLITPINLDQQLLLLSEVAELPIPIVLVFTMLDLQDRFGIQFNFEEFSKNIPYPLIILNENSSDYDKSVFFKDKLNFFLKEEIKSPHQSFKLSQRSLNFEEKFALIRVLTDKLMTKKRILLKNNWMKIDHLLTHPVWGLFIFFFILFGIFYSVYFLADPLVGLFENLLSYLETVTQDSLHDFPLLSALFSKGIIGGVGSILTFLPQIMILFFFVSILEETGYMSRAAFLMDYFMARVGLNGRSFIPMMSGFACTVPAILSTRVIQDASVRLRTILILPLISCSARLPVYVLLVSSIIEPIYGMVIASFVLIGLHFIGIVLALIISKFFFSKIKSHHTKVFFMEMTPLQLPKMKNIYFRVKQASENFVKQAGGIILAISIIIWTLSYFGYSQSQFQSNVRLNDSFLGVMGKTIEPVFKPLGFDWRITIGILSAFPARELIISSFGIIFKDQNDLEDLDENQLRSVLKEARKEDQSLLFTPVVAFSLMIFFSLCSQCGATLATVYKELGSWKWTLFVFSYMTILAYVCSMAVYQIGILF